MRNARNEYGAESDRQLANSLLGLVGDAPTAPRGPIPIERLLAAIDYHGLAARARFAFDRDRQAAPWHALERLAGEIDDVYRDQVAVLRQVRPALGQRPPLVLKGPIVGIALSDGDRRFVRRSGDVDLLVERPATVIRRLASFGFKAELRETPHELAQLRSGRVTLDVHRHFPVNTLPSPATEASHRRQGHWYQRRSPLKVARLSYEQLMADSIDGAPAGLPGYRVPSPTSAALIATAHLYSSYHYAEGFPKVRLGELDDAARFIQHPAFSQSQFKTLLGQSRAKRSAELVGYLISHIPALAALQSLFGRVQRLPPQDLWWNGLTSGFVADTTPVFGLDDILLNRIRLNEWLRFFGTNPVALSTVKSEPIVAQRVLSNTRASWIRVRLEMRGDAMLIELLSTDSRTVEASVHFGTSMVNSTDGKGPTLRGSFRSAPELVSVNRSPDGCQVNLTITRSPLTISHGTTSAAIMMAVRARATQGHDVVIVPMTLRWDHGYPAQRSVVID